MQSKGDSFSDMYYYTCIFQKGCNHNSHNDPDIYSIFAQQFSVSLLTGELTSDYMTMKTTTDFVKPLPLVDNLLQAFITVNVSLLSRLRQATLAD